MKKILMALSDGQPRASADIAKLTSLNSNVVWAALRRYWHKDLILRSKLQIRKSTKTFRGRAGFQRNLRSYYLYILKLENACQTPMNGIEFINYSTSVHCHNTRSISKAKSIYFFLKSNSSKAYFTTDICKALSNIGVKTSDLMPNIRRWEKKGLLLVRGYRLDSRQTPFKEGYLITCIDPMKSREEAIKLAIERTEEALNQKGFTNPTIQRIHRVQDMILEASKLRELVSTAYIYENLKCSKYEAEVAMNRAMQLYPHLKEVRLFDAFRYFYHDSMADEDRVAATAMKENYVRKTKGRANRVGHNWEAAVDWFIDRFTTGARFWVQNHRTEGMDSKRITIHLIKSVRGRIRAAEVDRVWEITPGVFSPSITYVLSCKWGLVYKRDIDDFFDILRWSKEFGSNSQEGREIKQGIVGVFAGAAFNPQENIRMKDCTISLPAYAARMNIQLLKAVDFNSKLRIKGCPTTISIQKICKLAGNEKQVREILNAMWDRPNSGEQILTRTVENNKAIYEFEKLLEQG